VCAADFLRALTPVIGVTDLFEKVMLNKCSFLNIDAI